MYYEDLTPYEYRSKNNIDPNVLNVGWLSKDIPFHTRRIETIFPDEFLSKLKKLTNMDNIVNLCRGSHFCEYCEKQHDEEGHRVVKSYQLGNGEIRVNGKDGMVYAAPVLIWHYVALHNYLPPYGFIEAVMES